MCASLVGVYHSILHAQYGWAGTRSAKKDGVQSSIATPLKPHHILCYAIGPFLFNPREATACCGSLRPTKAR